MIISKLPKKILFIRLDKIGDLICTMPVDEIFAEDIEKVWAVSQGMGAIAKAAMPRRTYFEFDKSRPNQSINQFAKLLIQEKPDIAISFQAPWWVHFQLWYHQVPIRIGVKSQWHSFLFLNHAVRQKRSQAKKHEFQYNLELANLARSCLGLEASSLQPILQLKANQKPAAGARPSQKDYIVVHPGMAGSALNWDQSQYIEWIDNFLKSSDLDVYLSGTAMDEIYLSKIKTHFANYTRVFNLQSKLNFSELLEILSAAQFVLAPSTGVAHLAASLGTKVKCIFSPIRVQSQERWSPRGKQVQIFAPQVNCPAKKTCWGDKCPQFNCMDKVQVDFKF